MTMDFNLSDIDLQTHINGELDLSPSIVVHEDEYSRTLSFDTVRNEANLATPTEQLLEAKEDGSHEVKESKTPLDEGSSEALNVGHYRRSILWDWWLCEITGAVLS